jgi:hypothetical protein
MMVKVTVIMFRKGYRFATQTVNSHGTHQDGEAGVAQSCGCYTKESF